MEKSINELFKRLIRQKEAIERLENKCSELECSFGSLAYLYYFVMMFIILYLFFA
jgi:SET domain-containing protein